MATKTSLLKTAGSFVSSISLLGFFLFIITSNVKGQIPDACKPIQAEIEALQAQLKFTTKLVRVYDPDTRRYYWEEREVPDPGNAAIELQIAAKQAELRQCVSANPCFAKPMIFIPTADALEAMGYTGLPGKKE